MISPLMQIAITLHFKIGKLLLPFPFSWNPSAKTLTFEKKLKLRFIPWYCMIFCGQFNAACLCIGLMIYDIVTPLRILNLFQLLTCIVVAVIAFVTILLSANLVINASEITAVFDQMLSTDKNALKSYMSRQEFLDPVGVVLTLIVLFFAAVPLVFTPMIVYNNIDPMHVFFYLTIPSFLLEIPEVTMYILPAIRYGGILMGAAEGCRTLCFTVVLIFCVLTFVGRTIEKLICRCRQIIHEFVFISHFMIYLETAIIVTVVEDVMSLIILAIMSISSILIVLCGYNAVALISVVPMPLYLVFPVAAFMSQISTAKEIDYGISWYEGCRTILAMWKFSIVALSRRKYAARRLKSVRPIRVNAKLMGTTLYCLKQSTMTTFFHTAAVYIMNAVLLVPPTK